MKRIILTLLLAASAAFAQQTPTPSPSPTPAAFDGSSIIQTAMKEYGVYKDPYRDSARVKEYVVTTGNGLDQYTNDEWCSAFAAWDLKENGFKYPSNNYAIAWDIITNHVDKPEPGDLVLMRGHISFFLARHQLPNGETVVLMLGGNQAHEVKISTLSEGNIIEYREPVPQEGEVIKSDPPTGAESNKLDDRFSE